MREALEQQSAQVLLYCTTLVTEEDCAMTDVTFTFQVDETLKSEFSTAAKACDRNSAQLLRDFMRDFVRQQEEAAAHDAWFRRQVQIGLDSANAGNLIPATEVEAKFAAKRAATRRKMASGAATS
jgi:predicted transcriptional regulator